ncbi:hypothetical protein SKAU_G00157760 [Synaphobranchus kaupii]|uniref:Gypsy retrotransposon integrase-like protein 1 n=1 Tax=Synaphobranchus kaupii TaxID=118154 RepID=A0A9Q1IYK3_SYNKA|nr:hypothetical protein SKAU_G00157760 [Synaphobranchus kaupii]
MKAGVEQELLLVPRPFIPSVLQLAHTHLLGAHLGAEKTLERIKTRFYWPGVKKAVEDYCHSCPDCQLVAPRPHLRSPLIPLPIISVPFSRIGMDLVGPLPRSSRGHQYILVVLDYATRYPEAIPLRTMATKGIARELMLLFSRVGLPEEILTDQGTPFMSRIMRDLCQLMKVTQLRTSVYHPQTDGLVERFNQTLKKMLKKTMEADGRNWDQLLPFVLFAIRKVPQASTGFSPFELLYGRRPRGLLDLAKEAWEQQPSPHRTMVEHVEEVRERMATIWPMVREHMAEAQTAQARVYNRGAQPREFAPGDKVLVLVPTSECKFLAKWNGPYEVIEKVGAVNYRVAVKTESVQVPMGEQLTPSQQQDLQDLVNRNRDVFSAEAGHTDLIQHRIITEPGKRVKLRPYRIPEARREAIAAELPTILLYPRQPRFQSITIRLPFALLCSCFHLFLCPFAIANAGSSPSPHSPSSLFSCSCNKCALLELYFLSLSSLNGITCCSLFCLANLLVHLKSASLLIPACVVVSPFPPDVCANSLGSRYHTQRRSLLTP